MSKASGRGKSSDRARRWPEPTWVVESPDAGPPLPPRREGELETFRAVDLAAAIHPDNAQFVRGKVPAKIASNYFGDRLGLPLHDFTAWAGENAEWPQRLIAELGSPDTFRRTAELMAEEVRRRAAA